LPFFVIPKTAPLLFRHSAKFSFRKAKENLCGIRFGSFSIFASSLPTDSVSKKLKKNRHAGESRHPHRNLFITPFRDYGYNPQHKRKYPAISTTSLVNGEILIILHHR